MAVRSGKLETGADGPGLLPFLRRVHGLACYVFIVVVCALHFGGWVDLSHLVWLSYERLGSDAAPLYSTGPNDLWFVAFWVILLTGLRVVVQGLVYKPIAVAFKCSADNVVKFQEMGWQNLYYTLAWCSGMYISWFGSHAFFRFENGKLNTASWWKGYPNHPLYAEHKLYYLLQLAFWIHMVFVTLIEKWRKDFAQMMAHHFFTILLLSSSYFQHFHVSGTFVLIVLDVADIFLPLAKMLNYLRMKRAADIVFALFTVVWIPTRHGLFAIPFYSYTTEAALYITEPYDPSKGNYFHPVWSLVVYNTCFVALEVLMLFWLSALIKAVHKAFSAGHMHDTRSDSDDDDGTSKRKPAAARTSAPPPDPAHAGIAADAAEQERREVDARRADDGDDGSDGSSGDEEPSPVAESSGDEEPAEDTTPAAKPQATTVRRRRI